MIASGATEQQKYLPPPLFLLVLLGNYRSILGLVWPDKTTVTQVVVHENEIDDFKPSVSSFRFYSCASVPVLPTSNLVPGGQIL